MKKIIMAMRIPLKAFLMGLLCVSVLFSGWIDAADNIRERMISLGFLESKIAIQRDESYSIEVNAYVQKSRALSLKNVFRPFKMRAKFSDGILYLEKFDLEKAGFSVQEKYLPSRIKITRMEIQTQSFQTQKFSLDSNIQQIERALKDTKQNRSRVFANTRSVVHKSNSSFLTAFPDVCKTPPQPGSISIPYPNTAMSRNTSKSSKKIKADLAASIAKDSDRKKSESDELDARMTKLQKSYQKISASRQLTPQEAAKFKKDLKFCLDRAAFLEKTLEAYIEEIEKLLKEVKK